MLLTPCSPRSDGGLDSFQRHGLTNREDPVTYVWCPRPLMLQTLIFPKGTFDAIEAFDWLGHYGYAPKKLEETGQSFRARLYPPSAFVKGSFRTISMGRGKSAVRAVVGCPKPATFQREAARRARVIATKRAAKRKAKR